MLGTPAETVVVPGPGLSVNGVAYQWPSAPGAANTVLQSDDSGNLSWAAVAGDALLSGEVASATSYNIPGPNGTWSDTGFGIDIPAAGTYLIFVNVRVYVQIGDSAYLSLQIKLYQDDKAADVAQANRFCVLSDTSTNAAMVNQNIQATAAFSFVGVTFTAATRLRLYARRAGTSNNVTAAQIVTDANGGTTMGYLKIG